MPKKRSISYLLFGIVIIAIILLLLLLFLPNKRLLGGATIYVNNYNTGNALLTGFYELKLREGELLPLNTTVKVTLEKQGKIKEKNLSLKEWLDASNVSYPIAYGRFYKEGTRLGKGEAGSESGGEAGSESGSESEKGEGVGIAGKIVEKPEIRFRLRIFPSEANATTNETTQPQPTEPTQPTQSTKTIQSEITGSVIKVFNPLNFFYFTNALRNLLAFVISEQEIEASINADKPFIYEIPVGYDAEIINDSIVIDGKPASIELLKINKETKDNITTITIATDYVVERSGFGEEFLGKVYSINLSLSTLNFSLDPGDPTLTIELVYNNETLSSETQSFTAEQQLQPPSQTQEVTTSQFTTLYTPEGDGVCSCTSCGNCIDALNDSTNCYSEVKLTTDIFFAGTCINNPENFNNKVLNCQGYRISGAGDDGIYLVGKSGNTIRNCIITGFNNGIVLSSSSNNIIINNSIYGNIQNGIYLQSSSNNTITNNTASNNGEYGIYLSSSSNNTIDNNTASNNSNGIYLSSSSSNNVSGNIIENSSTYDIYVTSDSNYNLIYLNMLLSKGIRDEALTTSFYSSYSPFYFNAENFTEILYVAPGIGCAVVTADNQTISFLDGSTNLDLILVNDSLNPACGIPPSGLRAVYCVGCVGFGITNCSVLEQLLGLNPGDCRYFKPSAFVAQGLNDYLWNDTFNSTYYVLPGYASPPYLKINTSAYSGTNIYNVSGEGNFYVETATPLPMDSGPASITSLNVSDSTLSFTLKPQSSLWTVYYDIYIYNSTETWHVSNTTDLSYNVNLQALGLSSGNYTLKVVPFVLGSRYNATAVLADFTYSGPSGICTCDSCSDCMAKLNDPACTEVYLTSDIIDYGGGCIYNPANFTNKIFDCQGHTIDGTGNGEGIYLNSKENNTIKNCIISGFYGGIYLWYSSNITIVNNTVLDSNGEDGIQVMASSYNTIVNNTIKESSHLDISVWNTESDDHCNNIIENNTGSGDRPIKYFNYSVSLENEVLSELILCNADNSSIKNITVIGSDSIQNNGIQVDRTENSNFTDINSSDNFIGIVLSYFSSNNTLTNIVTNHNAWFGIILFGAGANNITNITANNNYNGVTLFGSSYNILSDINADNNSGSGIYLSSSSNNTLINNTARFNQYGLYATSDSVNNTLTFNIFCSNSQYDIYDEDSNSGHDNICSLAYNYNDAGTIGCTYSCPCYCESCSDCMSKLNNPACTEVRLTADITDYAGTCINNPVNFNNKVFDCQGHIIDGDNSGVDFGIYLYGKANNTIKNCVITEFYHGIYLNSSSNNTITNNTANSNYDTGIYLSSSSNNILVNNTASNNGAYGIYLSSSSNNTINNNTASNNGDGIELDSSPNNTIINNIVNNNANYGIYLSSFSNDNIIANNSINNNWDGIFLHYSSNNILTNNTLNNNDQYGIGLFDASYNIIINNIIVNNNEDGIYLSSSSSNNITSNIIENSSIYDIYVTSDSNYNLIYLNMLLSKGIRDEALTTSFYSSYSPFYFNGENFTEILYGAPGIGCAVVTADNQTISFLDGSTNLDLILVNDSLNPVCGITPSGLRAVYCVGCAGFGITNCSVIEQLFGLNPGDCRYFKPSAFVAQGLSDYLWNDTFNATYYVLPGYASPPYLKINTSAYSGTNIYNVSGEGNFYVETATPLPMDSGPASITSLNVSDSTLSFTLKPQSSLWTVYYDIYIYNSTHAWHVSNTTDLSYNVNLQALGLSSGNYTLKVVPFVLGSRYNATAVLADFTYSGLSGICTCDSCSDCMAKLNDPACMEVRLTADIIDYAGTCIDNPANFTNKTFDCQGHIIDGTKSGYYSGINLNQKNNNTIKNCVIREFYRGINTYRSWNITIVNNIFINNTNIGLFLYKSGGSASNISNNTFYDNYYNFFTTTDACSSFPCEECNYNFDNTNNIGDGLPIKFFGNAAGLDLHDEVLNGLYLCNVQNSSLRNITLTTNSQVYKNGAFEGDFIKNTTFDAFNLTKTISTTFLYSTNNTIQNSIINNSNYGIQMYYSSSNNTIANNTISNLLSSTYGIYLYSGCNYNNIINNTIRKSGYGIIYILAVYNNISNNIINNVAVDAIYLSSSNYNTITNNIANNNGYSIYLSSSSNNTLTNNTAINNTQWDFYSTSNSLNNIVTNLNISFVISFTSNAIALKSATAPAPDPAGYTNISKYISVENTSAGGWLFLNVSYDDAELDGINESTLRIWKYNDSWYSCSDFASDCGVDTVNNVVYANITSFSIFAPLGQVAPTPPTPPTPPPTPPPENHPPEITEHRPESLELNANLTDTIKEIAIEFYVKAEDEDDDNLVVEFLEDGKKVRECSGKGIAECSFLFAANEPGSYAIKAIAKDEKGASDSVEWRVDIVNATVPCIDEWNCSEWSECIGGWRYRECHKLNPECKSNAHKPEERIKCEVVEGCEVINCSDWGECKIEIESWKDLLKGIIMKYGKQYRTCYYRCKGKIEERNESASCIVREELIVEKGEECYATHYYVKDPSNRTLAKIKMPSLEKGLDIKLLVKKEVDYCWYCFDGKKDYDETGIDCGGEHCPACMPEIVQLQLTKKKSQWPIIAIALAAIVLLISVVFALVRTKRKKKTRLPYKESNIRVALAKMAEKYRHRQ